MRRNLLIELMRKSGEKLVALYLCVSGHPAGTLSHLSHGDPGDHPRASIVGVRVCSACESGVEAGCLEPSDICPGDFGPLWRRIA